MHDEKSNSINEVRSALNLINLEISKFPIGSPVRISLEQASVVLESLIWKLVHEDLKEITSELEQHQSQLQQLNKELEAESNALNNITGTIEKVSQLIGDLASLVLLLFGVVIL